LTGGPVSSGKFQALEEISPMDILVLCLIIAFFALSWRFVLACEEIRK
jgi:hypothetical protein